MSPPVTQPVRRKRGVPWWLRLIICAAILGFIFSRVDRQQLHEAWRRVTLWHVLPAMVIMWLNHVHSACRWYILLRCVDPSISLWRVVRVSLVSLFLGMFMPGTVGLEVARIIGVTRANVPATKAILSVVLDRLLGILSLAVAVLLGILVAPHYVEPPAAIAAGLFLAGIMVAFALITSPAVRQRILALIPQRLATAAAGPLEKATSCIDAFRNCPFAVLTAFGSCLLTQGFRIATIAAVAWALRVEVPLPVLIVAVPMVTFVSMIPITIGGLGVREAGYVYFLVLVGVSTENALLMSISLYLVLIVTILPGGVLWLFQRKEPDAGVQSEATRSSAAAPLPIHGP